MSIFSAQQPQQQNTSLFGGNNQPQQQQQSGGIFGASQNNAQPATTSIFGQPNPQQQQPTQSLFSGGNTGGGLFGNNAQGASGGLFGGQQQQQQTQPTGGLFGNTQQNQPSGSNIFGNPQQQQQQQQQGAQPQANAGGLFGSNTGGGLFGAKPAGGIAGAPTLPSLNTNTTGGSSLFGGSTLGQQPTQQQQQGASSFFSQPTQNQNQQQRPPLFGGAPSTTNIFGASTNNNNGKSTFGSSLGLGLGLGQQGQQQQNPNPLGASTLTASTLRTPASGPQQQVDAQTQFARLTARIEGITAAWNAASPQCQFQYYFYNRVDPNQVGLYGRPPNATNEVLWTKAVRENPDPSCLVPAIAVGFDDLRQRVDAQGQQAAAHQERLKDLKTRLATLSSTQHQNSARLARVAALQTQLTHRLLALAAHLHLLVPALRSSGLRAEEEDLRGWLEELREEVGVRGSGGGSGGGGGGRMRGKLGELWALVGALGAAREGNNASGGEWKVVDEEGLARIAQILSEQQAGLVHLTKILKGDLADINVVLKGGGRGEEGDGAGDDLWGSRRSR
ncbi:nucleoporin complex subunit 54-domain-containing protein [Mycena maculata]|uniref:Nucleoporin complex subunit 54-domain-containing protein n=1 Tax=Mycena maculata TaxID=230809 RepID=A0AAD7NM85_9AGAR|nr:nucleoporin complex subunit 54-domain-containing protein [Mycena maculata]